MAALAEPAPELTSGPTARMESDAAEALAPPTRLPQALIEVARQAWGGTAMGMRADAELETKVNDGAEWCVPFQDLFFEAGESCEDGMLGEPAGLEEEGALDGEGTGGGLESGTAPWEAAIRLLTPAAPPHWVEAAAPRAAVPDVIQASEPGDDSGLGMAPVTARGAGARGWAETWAVPFGRQVQVSESPGETKAGAAGSAVALSSDRPAAAMTVDAMTAEALTAEAAGGEDPPRLPSGEQPAMPEATAGEASVVTADAPSSASAGEEPRTAAKGTEGRPEVSVRQAPAEARNGQPRQVEMAERPVEDREAPAHVAGTPRAEPEAGDESGTGEPAGREAGPVRSETAVPAAPRKSETAARAVTAMPDHAAMAAVQRAEAREPGEGQDGDRKRAPQTQPVEKRGRAGSAWREKEPALVEPAPAPAARAGQGHRVEAAAHEVPAVHESRGAAASAGEPLTIADRMLVRDITPPATPLAPRTLQVQVTGAGGEDVQATISATAAGVQVRLRAAESGLSQAIEQGAPVLRERLEEIQMARAAEPWDAARLGGDAVGGLHAAGESSLQQGAGGESQGREPGSPGEGERRQGQSGGERRQRDAEADGEEFEAYFQAGGQR